MSGIVLATGDIAPDREEPEECFAATRELLHSAELVFGQLETSFADHGVRLPQARHAVLSTPKAAQAVAEAGYTVISCAGNHCLDWGPDALRATIANLGKHGVKVIGAGDNIAAARKPYVHTMADGTRIAMLAYCSILPQAFWAEANRSGCVPMRAHTLYEQIEHDQPGTPPRIHTFAHREDLAAMEADIRAAKADADLVFVSQHWGIHFVRAVIADYQREVARACIAAGADAIFGHHAHILKGIEVIEGKPVFYSLCNFATDLRMTPEHAARKSFKEIQALAEKWEPNFDSLYNFPETARNSMIARLVVSKGKITEAGFLPLYIEDDAIPRVVDETNPRFAEVLAYMRAITGEAALNASYAVRDGRVVIEGIG